MRYSNPNIAVVILAAGSSSRMGSPKQLLKWGNKTLLTHAIQTASKLKTKELILVLGANYKLIETKVNNLPITVLNNKEWQLGLGKSIACAIRYVLEFKSDVDGVLITLADQPFVDSDFLESMILNFNNNQYSIIAASYKAKKVGVPVIFDKKYFNELSQLEDDKGAKSLIEKYKPSVKALKTNFDNIDIDFIEDYEKLKPLSIK